MAILKLLHNQNRCLQKILAKSIQFLDRTQASDPNQIMANLEVFQAFRETAIKTLMLYDGKISKTIQELPDLEKTEKLIESIRMMLNTKETLVQSVLDNDQKIIGLIEEERTRLLKELSSSNKNSQNIKKFKSTWMPEAGEKLDGKL